MSKVSFLRGWQEHRFAHVPFNNLRLANAPYTGVYLLLGRNPPGQGTGSHFVMYIGSYKKGFLHRMFDERWGHVWPRLLEERFEDTRPSGVLYSVDESNYRYAVGRNMVETPKTRLGYEEHLNFVLPPKYGSDEHGRASGGGRRFGNWEYVNLDLSKGTLVAIPKR